MKKIRILMTHNTCVFLPRCSYNTCGFGVEVLDIKITVVAKEKMALNDVMCMYCVKIRRYINSAFISLMNCLLCNQRLSVLFFK